MAMLLKQDGFALALRTCILSISVITKGTIPLDVNTWGLMALGDKYKRGIRWMENHSYVEADGFKGFDFNDDREGIWFEGTAQMSIACRILGDEAKSDIYIGELRKAQTNAQNANGKGIVAASHNGVSTGFGWVYNAQLHAGATSWYIFAEKGYNPYWNVSYSPLPPVKTSKAGPTEKVAGFEIVLSIIALSKGYIFGQKRRS